MGFSLGGILKAVFTTATSIIKVVTNNPKPPIEMILPEAAGTLFKTIMEASKYQDLTSKEKIDSWLGTMDTTFGSEASALDVMNSLPSDKEEVFTDHIIEAARVVLYNKAKIEGYWQET